MIILVPPMPKPRMTRSDSWRARPAVLRYRQWCDMVRAEVGSWTLPEAFRATFWMPMPASWSFRRREQTLGLPHQQRPDLDNLIKALMDALLVEDSAVWSIGAEKRWSTEGRIEVEELR